MHDMHDLCVHVKKCHDLQASLVKTDTEWKIRRSTLASAPTTVIYHTVLRFPKKKKITTCPLKTESRNLFSFSVGEKILKNGENINKRKKNKLDSEIINTRRNRG